MSQDLIVEIFTESIKIILIISAPILISGLLVGLIIAIFQATTQIQEPTLAFVPKIAVVFIVMLILGPWIIQSLVEYTEYIMSVVDVVVQ